MAPSSLFIRPRNMPISTMLQTLSITANIARRSGGKVIHAVSPREPYAQRILSFAGVTINDSEAARQLSNQADHYIGLTNRAAMSYSALYYELPMKERGTSLADIASIIGLRLGDQSYDYTKIAESKDEENTDASRRIANTMNCKIERRQTSAKHRPSQRSVHLEARNHRRLISAMNEFAGFSDRLKVEDKS